MDITVKILDLPNVDFPGDNHYIIVESADLNETQKASLRQLYSYIAKQGIVTNVVSNQKGIEVSGDSTTKYIKWMPLNWESNITFKKDDLIIYNHILYKCLIEHTSGGTFNSAYFESIGADIQAATVDSLGLVRPDGQTIMINSNGVISTSSRNGIFWHVSAIEPTENLSTTDYWLNTTTGEIKQYNGSEWGESLGTIKGPEGPQGLRGIKGDKGDKGDTGEAGAQGEKGERGPQGVQGLTGPQGPQGEAGAPFTYDMFTEEQLAALIGPQGEVGPQGEKGETGPQGATGAAFTYDMFTSAQLAALVGPRGYSAYEVAVNNSYEGTEEQWLASLKGVDGTAITDITQSGKTINVYVTNEEIPYSFTLPGSPGEWIKNNLTAERFNDYETTIEFVPGDYSHMEGYQTRVTGVYGHAEGNGTSVRGEAGHAENTGTAAGGTNSHAGGNSSSATGENSFTHGESTQANYKNSASFGNNTTTSRENQFVTGAFNEDDETALFIVGGGTLTNRKNVLVVDEEGNLKIKGQINPTNGYVNLPYKGEKGIQIVDNEDNSKTISLSLGEGLELGEDGSVNVIGGSGGIANITEGTGILITENEDSSEIAVKIDNDTIVVDEEGNLKSNGLTIENAIIIKETDTDYLLHSYTQVGYISGNKIGYAGPENQVIVQGFIANYGNNATAAREGTRYTGGKLTTFSGATVTEKEITVEIFTSTPESTAYRIYVNGTQAGSYTTYNPEVIGFVIQWENINGTKTEAAPYGYAYVSLYALSEGSTGTIGASAITGLTRVNVPFISEAEYNAAVGLTYEPNTLINVEETITEA